MQYKRTDSKTKTYKHRNAKETCIRGHNRIPILGKESVHFSRDINDSLQSASVALPHAIMLPCIYPLPVFPYLRIRVNDGRIQY